MGLAVPSCFRSLTEGSGSGLLAQLKSRLVQVQTLGRKPLVAGPVPRGARGGGERLRPIAGGLLHGPWSSDPLTVDEGSMVSNKNTGVGRKPSSCQSFADTLHLVIWVREEGGGCPHANRKLTGVLSSMYSPMPTKYMTWAMPNRGAMTRALQPAPFRKAAGPSFLMILLTQSMTPL